MNELAIRTQGLSRRFGKQMAVRGLSLEIPRGSVFGLIGPNGAGKTTTLRMLAGLLPPTSGSIEVLGEQIVNNGRRNGVHRSVGYMPDFFGVYDDMLSWEYLDFFARCHDLPSERRARVVDELLELVDLSSKRNSQVDQLSRGMKQRLCLAQALVHDPMVLLLDEPASGLDPRARLEMRALLRELGAMGKTIVISSHILSELAEMCDGIGIMEHGELLDHGTVADLHRRRRPRELWRLGIASDLDAAVAVLEAIEGVEVIEAAVVETPMGGAGGAPDSGADPAASADTDLSPAADRADLADLADPADPVDPTGVADPMGPASQAPESVIVLAFDGDTTTRAALLTRLITAGVAVADLRPVEGDLEELFMEITRGGTEE